ncbi:MAG: hypothetical protein LBD99_01840 [Candidatus Margulisbacteria bacterium]|nr:hypothetical protein [Candidatus Margulisiibacteriota bacterium]
MLNTIGSDSKLPVRSTKNILDIYAKYNGTPLSANINAAIETLKSGGTDPNNLWADAQYALSMYERARDMLPEFQRQADETAQLLNNAVGSAQCDGLTIGDGEIPYRRPEGFSSSALLPQMLKIYSERFDLLSQNELTHNMGVFQIALGVKGEQQTDGTTKYTVEVIDTTKQNGEEFLPPGKAGDGEPEPTSTGSQRLPGNSPSRRAVNMGTPYIDGHGNMCLVMHTNITTPEEYMIYKTPEGVWGVVVLDYSSHTHAVSSGVHNIVETRYIKDNNEKKPNVHYNKYESVQDLLKVIGSDRWAAGVVRLSNSDLFTLISNSGSSYFRTINGRGGTQMSADDQKKYKFLLELYEIETGESIQGYEKIQDIEKTRNGRNSRIFS